MAHRNVMDKDGNSKQIHSSHGDVAHPEAHSGHAAPRGVNVERSNPHGEHAHPEMRKSEEHEEGPHEAEEMHGGNPY